MSSKKLVDGLKIAIIIIGVIALGMFAINQTYNYFYKTKLLLDPCSLCKQIPDEKNPYSINLTGELIMPKP